MPSGWKPSGSGNDVGKKVDGAALACAMPASAPVPATAAAPPSATEDRNVRLSMAWSPRRSGGGETGDVTTRDPEPATPLIDGDRQATRPGSGPHPLVTDVWRRRFDLGRPLPDSRTPACLCLASCVPACAWPDLPGLPVPDLPVPDLPGCLC